MKELIPLGDNIIVEPLDAEAETSSGILIPDTVEKDKPIKGKVIAVGPGRLLETGDREEMTLKVNDTILFSKYGPAELKVNNRSILVLAESDVYAKIES